MKYLLVFLFFIGIYGCAGSRVKTVHFQGVLDKNGSWALLPMLNHSRTPEAGLKTEAIAAAVLRSHLHSGLSVYPKKAAPNEILDLNQWRRFDEAKTWAKGRSVRYGLSGAVQEWRYKRGLEGEPVVALTLEVVDLKYDDVVWSASFAVVGSFRESVSGVAQRLLDEALGELLIIKE